MVLARLNFKLGENNCTFFKIAIGNGQTCLSYYTVVISFCLEYNTLPRIKTLPTIKSKLFSAPTRQHTAGFSWAGD